MSPSITPQQLGDMAAAVAARHPDATLVKNQVGNLSILDADGQYVGFLDLGLGEVGWLDD